MSDAVIEHLKKQLAEALAENEQLKQLAKLDKNVVDASAFFSENNLRAANKCRDDLLQVMGKTKALEAENEALKSEIERCYEIKRLMESIAEKRAAHYGKNEQIVKNLCEWLDKTIEDKHMECFRAVDLLNLVINKLKELCGE